MADYLKIPELARRLDVSEKTARRYVKAGTLPSTFIGGAYRVTEEDLDEFLHRAEVKPEDVSPKGSGRSSPEPSLFNGLEEERHAGVISWAAYTRQIASRVRGHADDPNSPAFRDPWSALFFVEEANRNATDLNRFVDEQLTAALEIADLEAMHELMAAFEELDRAIDTASARARLMEAGRSHSEIGEARRRAKEAATERESAAAELSGHLGHSA